MYNGVIVRALCNLETPLSGICFDLFPNRREAFLHMVQHSREDIASGRVRWSDLTPPEWRDGDERAVAPDHSNKRFSGGTQRLQA